MRAAIALVSILALLAVMPGCFSARNPSRLTIGEDVALPAIQPDAALRNADSAREGFAPVDRSTWEPVVFLVPVEGVEHGPLAYEGYPNTKSTARQRREYPTAEQALVLTTEQSRKDQAVDFVWAPAWNLWQAALLVPRLVVEGAAGSSASPRDEYERLWPNYVSDMPLYTIADEPSMAGAETQPDAEADEAPAKRMRVADDEIIEIEQ